MSRYDMLVEVYSEDETVPDTYRVRVTAPDEQTARRMTLERAWACNLWVAQFLDVVRGKKV